ncbi:MAG: glycosyltransferase family 39 protein [Pyrinomonadaceae bacterium]|nr:glycosyltransferase family 39 protein [Pyrinomonadaceae bacterium]
MKAIAHEKRSAALFHPLLFLLLSFIAYYSILNSYFLSDDFAQIGKVLEGDWSLAWGREYGGFFRPLFILSYIIDSRVWGERPFGYHLTNTLLHALNSCLVYSLTRRLLRPQKLTEDAMRVISLVAGLLFLVHPSHTEAVSWISGRADLLATVFCLTSLLAFISYVEKRRALYLLLAGLSFALALLSKESAVSLPFILFAFALYFAKVERRATAASLLRALKQSALFVPLLLLFILARRWALGAWVGGYGAGQHLNFSPGWIRDRFLQASLRALLPAFPLQLSNILLKPLQSSLFILFALASAALIILLLRRRRRLEDGVIRSEQNGLLLLLVASFVLSLLPVINLRLSLFDTQGERFVYWPSAFTSILISYLCFILLRRRGWRIALALCLLIFYSVSLCRTNQTWREAAEISRAVKEELSRAASNEQSLIVVNAPDNLRGVPLFHNGLEEALRVFQPRAQTERVNVLSLHSIQSAGDAVELKREGEVFSLRLANQLDEFTRIADGADCVQVQARSRDHFQFRLDDCTQRIALLFFDAGKVYRVLSSEEPPR